MYTVLTKSPDEAAVFIKKGEVVAFPTETVYGLGADVFNSSAVLKIFKAKNRPVDNPLIVHISSLEQIPLLAKKTNPLAELLIERFFPGPLTIVLPKTEKVPTLVTAGLDTVGIRMPKHNLALQFLRACETPVCAPSANLSGKPSPTDWESVYEDLNGKISCILQGEVTEIGLESTVVDCSEEKPLVLRLGAVSVEELREIVPDIKVHLPRSGESVKSPGLKHRHYAPEAEVCLVHSVDEFLEEASRNAFIGLTDPKVSFGLKKVCKSIEEYAHEIYGFFRQCDRLGIRKIYCEIVPEKGIGMTLMDRLKRAARR
ncbi:MAG: L-threonylcarbamoyladenylate synthase [Pyrinomonadaceae bacterium]|nr:L-threonylcarbamoyladenylate synthase [Pyrinomonadaceae bacterium]MCX7639032.1 L-threonylcarbamoyladenylate synthase [Pyrinomonadaceae bacterium]MDW8303747.1 L-threonylcarbamoyladenylate synthase [Acidobacteriota bacterium]